MCVCEHALCYSLPEYKVTTAALHFSASFTVLSESRIAMYIASKTISLVVLVGESSNKRVPILSTKKASLELESGHRLILMSD
jgi:hypothetical protein